MVILQIAARSSIPAGYRLCVGLWQMGPLGSCSKIEWQRERVCPPRQARNQIKWHVADNTRYMEEVVQYL